MAHRRPAECRTRRLPVRGETYAITETGAGDEAVLLMHGWPDDRTVWRHQLDALGEAGFRAIAVDWIGHGDSSKPRDRRRYRIPEVGRDLAALLDALDIGSCHLVAHDYGATVGWEFAASHGERLRSYCAVSVGPSIEILRDMLAGHLVRYHWLLMHGSDRLSRRFYLSDNAARFRKKFASHRDADRILAKLEPGRDHTFWTIWERANPACDVTLRWLRSGGRRTIRVPTIGVYTLRDEWMTEGQMRRAGRHVDAPWHYATLDSGHWPQLERPDQFNALLVDWLGHGRR